MAIGNLGKFKQWVGKQRADSGLSPAEDTSIFPMPLMHAAHV